MAEEKNASVKVNEDAQLGPAGRQVKPTAEQSSKEIKASLVFKEDAELHPDGLPEHEADQTSIPGPKFPPLDRPPVATTRPDVPIITSLVTGAGAHEPPDPEKYDAAGRPKDA
jgi:hypothetical protein